MAEFKLIYVGSALGSLLGYLWALARPLFTFAIIYIVFSKVLGDRRPRCRTTSRCSAQPEPVSLLCGDRGKGHAVVRGQRGRAAGGRSFLAAWCPSQSCSPGCSRSPSTSSPYSESSSPWGRRRSDLALFPVLWLAMLVITMAFSVMLSTLFVRFRDVGADLAGRLDDAVLQLSNHVSGRTGPEQLPLDADPQSAGAGFRADAGLGRGALGSYRARGDGERMGLLGPFSMFVGICAAAVALISRRARTMAEDLGERYAGSGSVVITRSAISTGSPSSATRPFSSRVARSQCSTIGSMAWVTRTIVVPAPRSSCSLFRHLRRNSASPTAQDLVDQEDVCVHLGHDREPKAHAHA